MSVMLRCSTTMLVRAFCRLERISSYEQTLMLKSYELPAAIDPHLVVPDQSNERLHSPKPQGGFWDLAPTPLMTATGWEVGVQHLD